MAEGAPYPQCKPGFSDELSFDCWLGVEGFTAHAEYQGGMGCGFSQPTLSGSHNSSTQLRRREWIPRVCRV